MTKCFESERDKVLIPFPAGKFGAILADPPWTFMTWSPKGKGRSPERHYQVMELDEIKALPVARLAASDCVLCLWATWPLLPQALEVIVAWSFTYKTAAFVWAKDRKDRAQDLFDPDLDFPFGTGFWTRSNTEVCLLATRGQPHPQAHDVR
jgi:N6-adenosine-specific RNA methylase IME4